MNIRFSSLTMESNRFICILEKMDKTDFVIIIDMNNPMNCIEKIITADLVIMNPTSKIIATKGKEKS